MPKVQIAAIVGIVCVVLLFVFSGQIAVVLFGTAESLKPPSIEAAEDVPGLPIEEIASTNMNGHGMDVYLLNKKVPCVVYSGAFMSAMACDFENGLESSLLEGFR